MDKPTQKSKRLVFSSVGDNHSIKHWLQGQKDFDLWIAYYGDSNPPDFPETDFCFSRKGGKFPNFFSIYKMYAEIIKRYDSIALLDDDLILSTEDINALFAIQRVYGLLLLQPAFLPEGKISHAITQRNESSLLRCTNFVEVTCPFFATSQLCQFMEVYDPVLVGFGIDWWYLDALKLPKGKIAIVDAIPCINPLDASKRRGREIEQLQSNALRYAHWQKIKKEYQIQGEGYFAQYAGIPNRSNRQAWLDWVISTDKRSL